MINHLKAGRSTLLADTWGVRSNVFLAILVFFLVFLSVIPQGFFHQPLGVSFLDHPFVLAEVFGYSDAGSYLRAAIELSELDGLTQDKHWVINLWPPGMVLLSAFLVLLFGNGYAIAFATVVALTWSIFISFFAIRVKDIWGLKLSVPLTILLIASGPFQYWIFGKGIFYAEGFAQIFFLMGMIALTRALKSSTVQLSLAYGVLAGTFVALASYFRASFSLIETLLLALSLIALFAWGILTLFKASRLVSKYWSRVLLALSSSWIAMFSLMEPWLRFTSEEIRGFRTWSVVGEGFLRGVWLRREDQADFLAAGGIGWGCELNPKFCETIYTYELTNSKPFPVDNIFSETISTIVSNLGDYIADRWYYISMGWFSVESAMGTVSMFFGGIALLGFLFFIGNAFRGMFVGDVTYFVLMAIAFFLILPSMVGHIEPRYFIPIKLLIVIYPWLVSPKLTKKSP